MTKDRIIYNEDGSFGVDEDSLNKFDLIFESIVNGIGFLSIIGKLFWFLPWLDP